MDETHAVPLDEQHPNSIVLGLATVRHPSTIAILRWFESEHLPAHLRAIAEPFSRLAHHLVVTLPDDPELTTGLRKLLEAKDCAVRARIAADEHTPPPWGPRS